MTVFLVRHAQAGSRIGAALDDDRLRTLTVEGRHQSAELAGILAVLGVTEILTSPYRRCIETAAPLAAALNVEVQITTALQEGPHDGALALVRQLASGSAAFFSHGDIIPGVLQSLAQEDNLDLGESPRCQKASIWILEAGSLTSQFVTATYISPPHWDKG